MESPLPRDRHGGFGERPGKRTGSNPDTTPQVDSTRYDTLHGEHMVGSIRDAAAPAFLRRLWELGYPFRVMPIVTEYEATFAEDDEPMPRVMWTTDGRSATCRHQPPGFTYLDAMTPGDI